VKTGDGLIRLVPWLSISPLGRLNPAPPMASCICSKNALRCSSVMLPIPASASNLLAGLATRVATVSSDSVSFSLLLVFSIVSSIPIALHIRLPFKFEFESLLHVQIDLIEMPSSSLFTPMPIGLVSLVVQSSRSPSTRVLRSILQISGAVIRLIR